MDMTVFIGLEFAQGYICVFIYKWQKFDTPKNHEDQGAVLRGFLILSCMHPTKVKAYLATRTTHFLRLFRA